MGDEHSLVLIRAAHVNLKDYLYARLAAVCTHYESKEISQ